MATECLLELCTARTHGAPDSERDRQKQSQLETKASSHGGQCIPAGYCHAHMLLYESGVNYNLNSKYTKYFAQNAAEYLRFGIFPPQISDSCVAPPTDGTAKC